MVARAVGCARARLEPSRQLCAVAVFQRARGEEHGSATRISRVGRARLRRLHRLACRGPLCALVHGDGLDQCAALRILRRDVGGELADEGPAAAARGGHTREPHPLPRGFAAPRGSPRESLSSSESFCTPAAQANPKKWLSAACFANSVLGCAEFLIPHLLPKASWMGLAILTNVGKMTGRARAGAMQRPRASPRAFTGAGHGRRLPDHRRLARRPPKDAGDG